MEEKKPLPGVEDKTQEYRDFKGKSRGFKGNRRSRRASGARGVPTRGANDFAFWNEYPELMSIATRFPWMHIAGTPLTGEGVSLNLPNVAIQHYFSIPGTASAATDPLNLAFRQMYLDLHRKYRGIGAYQASDIAITFICIESILQLIVESERIYGILKGYPIKSRIEPEGLLLAMGWTSNFITSVKENLADYRYSVNRIIELAKRLPLPQGMNFFKNHVVLNGFIYKDSNDERASLLAFVCDNYYHYEDGSTAASLNSAGTAHSKAIARLSYLDYKTWFAFIESELTNLMTDSDILRITSDFIACYGESNMQVLTPLPEDYRVEPTYSESILHKWHNSERVAVTVTDTNRTAYPFQFMYRTFNSSDQTGSVLDFCVYQRNAASGQDIVISAPTISVVDTVNYSPAWLTDSESGFIFGEGQSTLYSNTDVKHGMVNDSWSPDPSDEQRCESVLWKCMLEQRFDNTNVEVCTGFANCGTEILTILEMKAVSNSSVVARYLYEDTILSLCTNQVQDGLIMFDWHPYVFDIHPSRGVVQRIYGDVDNVTTISRSTVLKIMDAANLSAFKVSVTASGSGN